MIYKLDNQSSWKIKLTKYKLMKMQFKKLFKRIRSIETLNFTSNS